MKKIDIEKQLAQYPNTVFNVSGGHCLITGMEKAKVRTYGDYAWRVSVEHFAVTGEGDERYVKKFGTKRTYVLGQVEMVLWNTEEEALAHLTKLYNEREEDERVRLARVATFPAVRQELTDLFAVLGMKGYFSTSAREDRVSIDLPYADANQLIAVIRRAVA